MNEGSKKTIKLLCFSVLGMFTFSFALVPLYDVFCEVTGLNGKIELEATTNQNLELKSVETYQFNLFLIIMSKCHGYSDRQKAK